MLMIVHQEPMTVKTLAFALTQMVVIIAPVLLVGFLLKMVKDVKVCFLFTIIDHNRFSVMDDEVYFMKNLKGKLISMS